MRFRVRRKGRAGHISVPEKPEKKAVPLKAADLDNPSQQGRPAQTGQISEMTLSDRLGEGFFVAISSRWLPRI